MTNINSRSVVEHKVTSWLKYFNVPIRTFLIQEEYPVDVIGKREGQGIYTGQADTSNKKLHIQSVRRILDRIPDTADLVVISEQPGNAVGFDIIQQHSSKFFQIVVARLGYYTHKINLTTNSIAVFIPDGSKPIIIDQISLSVEDLVRGVAAGNEIHILSTPSGRIAVINCHDYTHPYILKELYNQHIDILIVPTFNPAMRLYEQYALSDIHRLFAFIIISNIANYGGSGIYVPFRQIGPQKRAIATQGALTSAHGPSVIYLSVELPLPKLHEIRSILAGEGSIEEKKRRKELSWTPPIFPEETILTNEKPLYKEVIEKSEGIEDICLSNFNYIATLSDGKASVAVAHLHGLDFVDYLKSFYHISGLSTAPSYYFMIKNNLDRLASQLRDKNLSLNFLVFPEVYLPLDLEDDLRNFSKEFNTIIIGGVEYDQHPPHVTSSNALGSNRCIILVPSANEETHKFMYTKLTRSQYDARTLPSDENDDWGEFEMLHGTSMLRFKVDEIGSFAVMICYDFSHLDITHYINTHNILFPPEILFIVAYNPDGELYRRCCIADSHRYYQYIVMCNVARFGGSGVFGPVRTRGERQTFFHAGQGAEGISVTEIDIEGLREARGLLDRDGRFKNFMKKPGIFKNR